MLGFLRSLLSRVDHDVFRFWDGTRKRSVDPLKVKAALDLACPDWASAAEDLLSAERTAGAGLPMGEKLGAQLAKRREGLTAKLVAASRKAFGLDDHSDRGRRETGLTDLRALDVFADYLSWVADVLEDTRPLPIGPASTDWAPAPQAPANSSDSPSTPSASPATEQGLSVEPSAAPSAVPVVATTENDTAEFAPLGADAGGTG